MYQIFPLVVVRALIFLSQHKLSSALYQKWAPLGNTVVLYCCSGLTSLRAARSRSQVPRIVPVGTRKLPLCSPNAHLTMQAVGLAVLVRSASPVEQDLLA